jgi:hypothetical protein
LVDAVDVDEVGFVDVVEVDVGVPPVAAVGVPAVPAGLPGTSLHAAIAAVAQPKPIAICLPKVIIEKTS